MLRSTRHPKNKFKLVYGRSSARQRRAMDKMALMQNAESTNFFDEISKIYNLNVRTDRCAGEGCRCNSSSLAQNGEKVFF